MASSQDSLESGTASRTRRRVSRVNYAEDTSFDDSLLNTEPTSETSKPASNMPPLLDKVLKSSSSKSTSLVVRKEPAPGPQSKRDRDMALEKFPMNWQPKRSPSSSLLTMLDFGSATVKADSCLHLADGSVFSPEGMFTF